MSARRTRECEMPDIKIATEVAGRVCARLQSNPAVTATRSCSSKHEDGNTGDHDKAGKIKPILVQIDDVIAEMQPVTIIEI